MGRGRAVEGGGCALAEPQINAAISTCWGELATANGLRPASDG
jgi:hypothetical protein